MKILLSGGWGYGNLGDDAILAATMKLLRMQYPQAAITVMTYDRDATERALRDLQACIVPSVHRHLIGTLALARFRLLEQAGRRKGSRFKAKIRKVYHRCVARLAYPKYAWLSRHPRAVRSYEEFQSADLFVMAGGAYLNSGWPDSVYAHALELIVAHTLGIRSIVVGQSIGPFHDERTKSVALAALRLATRISVRDETSYRDLHSDGIQCDLSPDIALADADFSFGTMPEIAIIANDDLDAEAHEHVAQAIAQTCREGDLAPKVLVTRLWEPDIKKARMFCDMLDAAGVSATFVIPEDHTTLQREIGVSRAVVSANLHGLVLGWRAGVPCVSLQAHGKYLAFMQQTQQGGRAFPSDRLDAGELTLAISDALRTGGNFKAERETISQQVALHFAQMVNT